MYKHKLNAFTLVELIVVITILAILGTIGFISMQGYAASARDSVRISDLQLISKSLELYQLKTGKYPDPSNGFNVTFSGANVWTQGTFGDINLKNVEKLNKLPLDPLILNEYTYSVLNTNKEYQLGSILEKNDIFGLDKSLVKVTNAETKNAIALIKGNYNGLIAKVSTGSLDYILSVPSIINSEIGDYDILNLFQNKKIVFDGFGNTPGGYKNLIITQNQDLNLNTGSIILFSGNISDLNDSSKQKNLILKLQDFYNGSLLSNIGIYKDLLSKDLNNLNNDSIVFINNIISQLINNNLKKIELGTKIIPTNWDNIGSDYEMVFANGSIFTKNWSINDCDTSNISIIEINPGTDVIPSSIPSNTIYKLNSGNYITSYTIYIDNNCSAIIGNGNVNLYSSVNLGFGGIIEVGDYNIILYGLNIDGKSDGIGGNHLINNNGIYNRSENSTLTNLQIYSNSYGIEDAGMDYMTYNNLKIYNNNSYGIAAWGGNNMIFSNIELYNNSYGILKSGGGFNDYYNNIIVYNNTNDGISPGWIYESSLNNIVSFNNGGDGIKVMGGNIISNNVQSYKNGNDGIYFRVDSGNTTSNINNIYSYNNLKGLESIGTNGDSYFYGNLKVFGNTNYQASPWPGDFTVGTSSILGFVDGTTLDTTGTFLDSYVVIPSVTGWNYNTVGKQALTFSGNINYTFGSNIINQVRPVKYNEANSTFELYGTEGIDYDSSKKIGQMN